MEIEIWSDVVCPFCFIGKRNLDKALAGFKNRESVTITYRSFELDPNALKSQTISIFEMLSKKYGRPEEQMRKANEGIVKMGQLSGIDFKMEKVIPTNSLDSHRLIHMARAKGLEIAALESLFKAYFEDGQDIAKIEVLTSIAQKIGMDASEVEERLKSPECLQEVRQEEQAARALGIQGVPYFVFNKRHALSGAQPAEVFADILNRDLTEH